MTRKDYNRIIDDLAVAYNATVAAFADPGHEQLAHGAARVLVRKFAREFARSEARENSRFDTLRFYQAVDKATGVAI